ncbi:MAG: hypothetical protein K0U86_11620 [Planctomycetes bacterium]|nr:hypothetical protein [Planctomycetota bacterium]MCH9725532.1 hypothetical protein [Planctomycetota bacterium]MCH9776475.1 hypothetical protein [Planctomycetota bacterium]MCH9790619.1 hypothetical protein [Planctomycetota bacterium]MDF1742145.1 hypothetical protein [Gimesia sp.]
MFEFEDHHSLEEQLMKVSSDSAIPLRGSHRQQVLDAARQARSRKIYKRSIVAGVMFFLAITLLSGMRDSERTQTAASDRGPGWSKAIYVKSSQVLGISTTTHQPVIIKTDWNSVQATLKQTGEWGLVDAVVQFRNERAGTIEQIFHRGD